MIDPKLNEIPADEELNLTEEERLRRQRAAEERALRAEDVVDVDTDDDLPIGTEDVPVGGVEDERLLSRKASVGRGLSINDTIARDANLSVGSRGVDVSGTKAGAGAGGGSTTLTPTPSETTAPEVVTDSRGTGMTPKANASSGQTSTDRRKPKGT